MNKYKKLYLEKEKRSLKRRITSGEFLYPFLYMFSGIAIVNLKWYLSIPSWIILVLIASNINKNVDDLKKELCQVEDLGVKQ